MIGRIFRAIRLDRSLYEEVESRDDLDGESWLIIGLIALINGIIGGIFGATLPNSSGGGVLMFFGIIILIFAGYIVSAAIFWFVGAKMFGGMANFTETRRVIAYAYTPYLLAMIPCINVLAILWFVATSFVAIRQTMDISNTRTIVVVIVASFFASIPQLCLQTFGTTLLSMMYQ